jgi:RHS repeat-associated protein
LTNRYLFGPAVDQVLADEQIGGSLLWPLTDQLGTVRDLINNSATVLNHIQWDSFGNRTSESNPAVDHLFAYTGRPLDEATGLQEHWNRWYDPRIARWAGLDPIKDGANWYAYVGNGPLTQVDPSGLEPDPRLMAEEALRRTRQYMRDLDLGFMFGDPRAIQEWDLRDADPTGYFWDTYYWHLDALREEAKRRSPSYRRMADAEQGPKKVEAARPEIDGREVAGLLADILQFGLDVGGIFEPTPFCDLTSGAISLGRGDLLGFGVSMLGLAPYLGDIAKAAKIPKYVGSVRRAITLIRKSEKLREVLRPALERLHNILTRVPLDCPPKPFQNAAEQVKSIRDELSAALKETGGSKTPVMSGTPSGPHGGGGTGRGSGGGGGHGGTPNGPGRVPGIPPPTNRGGLRPAMGQPPDGLRNPQAHHDLPWTYREWFAAEGRGLNVNDPAHGRWVSGTPPGDHQRWSGQFEAEWRDFIGRFPDADRQSVLDFMNQLRIDPRFQ